MHSTMGSNDQRVVAAWVLGTMLLPGAAMPLQALAQDVAPWPVRPVAIIAPFPPGGTSDVVARLIAQKLTDALGRQVVVENRGGAAANIGHEIAAKAAPDGYTLLLTSGAAMVNNQFLYKKLNWEPAEFTPISMVASAGMVLVVHPSVPATNVTQLIALARARPDRLSAGSEIGRAHV